MRSQRIESRLVIKETEGTTKEFGEFNAKIGGDGKVMFINEKCTRSSWRRRAPASRRGQGIRV